MGKANPSISLCSYFIKSFLGLYCNCLILAPSTEKYFFGVTSIPFTKVKRSFWLRWASSLSSSAIKFPQLIFPCLLMACRDLLKACTSTVASSISAIKRELKSLLYIENYWPTKHFFTRWKSFIEHSFSSSEIVPLMTSFLYTEWYAKANLTNSLRKLKIQDPVQSPDLTHLYIPESVTG